MNYDHEQVIESLRLKHQLDENPKDWNVSDKLKLIAVNVHKMETKIGPKNEVEAWLCKLAEKLNGCQTIEDINKLRSTTMRTLIAFTCIFVALSITVVVAFACVKLDEATMVSKCDTFFECVFSGSDAWSCAGDLDIKNRSKFIGACNKTIDGK